MTTFFTALAPEARIQGSRDPLGFLPVWSRLGRRIVRNVTTVSGDLRGWTTLLVSVGMVQDLVAEGAVEAASRDEVFFRAEQLVAFAREVHGTSEEVRGVSRVRARLGATRGGTDPIHLGTRPEQRILASQRSAGVWGQISRSAQVSGLIDRTRLRLAPRADNVWRSEWRPALRDHWRDVRDILSGRRGLQPAQGARDAALCHGLAALFGKRLGPLESQLVHDHILLANEGVDGPQARLVSVWRQTGVRPTRLAEISALAGAADAYQHTFLAECLRDISRAEALLAPAELIFRWLLRQDGVLAERLGDELDRRWGAAMLNAAEATAILAPPAESAYPGCGIPVALERVATGMVGRDWTDVIAGLLDINARVMAARGGAPWIEARGKLVVRLHDGHSDLPEQPHHLVHNYYLEPLRRLIQAWEDGNEP